MLRTVAVCAAFALLCSVPPLVAQEPANKPETTPTIKVDTRLVMVPVVVRDRKGQLVRNLKGGDFTLTDNNRPEPIRYFDRDSDAPLTVGLLVDVSGSQRDVLDEERTASSAFLDTLLRPDKDKAFIVQFGRQADLLADVTGSLPKLEAGLKKIDADSGRPQFSQSTGDPQHTGNGSGNGTDADDNDGSSDRGYGGVRGGHGGGPGGRGHGMGGGTVMYDAVFLASDEVIRKQTNRKALILLTDGDDRGSKESISSAIEAAQRADATVYAVYFKGRESSNGGFGNHRGGGFPGMGGGWPGGGGRGGSGGGPGRGGEDRVDGKKVLERICDETGGRVFQVTGKEHIDDIYRQISEELRSEYRLGFTPNDSAEGYHRLVVDLPGDRKSTIQARDGYYIGAGQ